jgi:RHS repeat-associated protein
LFGRDSQHSMRHLQTGRTAFLHRPIAKGHRCSDEARHLLGEYDDSGNLIEEMVYLGDIPVATLRPNGSGGIAIYYTHTDQLNAIRKISRPSDNAWVWQGGSYFDPFYYVSTNEDPSGLGTFISNLAFPGQYLDQETGLIYNGARYYLPPTGTYLESDPIGIAGGVNTYAYALENPLKYVDVNGLEIICGGYYCGTTTPAYPGVPGYSEPPPPSPCEMCQGGDKLTIHIDATVCAADDTTTCFLAMQAAGIPGPYSPHTNYYSKTCLSNLVAGLKLTGAAGGEALKNWGPGLASRWGLPRLALTIEALTSWEAVAVMAPLTIEQLGDECQCKK